MVGALFSFPCLWKSVSRSPRKLFPMVGKAVLPFGQSPVAVAPQFGFTQVHNRAGRRSQRPLHAASPGRGDFRAGRPSRHAFWSFVCTCMCVCTHARAHTHAYVQLSGVDLLCSQKLRLCLRCYRLATLKMFSILCSSEPPSLERARCGKAMTGRGLQPPFGKPGGDPVFY